MGRGRESWLVAACFVWVCGASHSCGGQGSDSSIPATTDTGREVTASARDLVAELFGMDDDIMSRAEVDMSVVDLPHLDTGLDVLQPSDLLVRAEVADIGGNPTLGVVSGSCGELAELFAASNPALVVNTYQFDDADSFNSGLLGSGAAKRYDLDNQGGSSLCSEVMSIQLLEECDGALLLKTETEISYDTEGSIADFTATLSGEQIGISVTRAYKGPMGNEYTVDDATALLTKKLLGLHEASANVAAEDGWDHSLLHVWTLRADWVPSLTTAWEALPPETRGTTVVMVTVEANSEWIVPEACKP